MVKPAILWQGLLATKTFWAKQCEKKKKKNTLGDWTKNGDEARSAESFPKLGALKKSHWNGERICMCLYVCQVGRGHAWLFDMQRTGIRLQAWQRGRHRSCPSAQSWRIESVPTLWHLSESPPSLKAPMLQMVLSGVSKRDRLLFLRSFGKCLNPGCQLCL